MAAERRWVSVPDMPRAVLCAAAMELEGKLLVIGGVTCSSVFEYDPGCRCWKQLPSMRQARYGCAVTVLGGSVVVMGGRITKEPKLVERYNRRSQCWEAMPSLPCALYSATAIGVRV